MYGKKHQRYLIIKYLFMADINLSTTGKSASSARRNIRIDMTPMVDLGFLLITFFIFSTTMSQPTAMKLITPVEGDGTTSSPQSKTLTLLLKENGNVLCYEGFAKDNTSPRVVNIHSTQAELRDIIQHKMKSLQQKGIPAEEMIVIIKPTMESNYNSLVAALDEMTINTVKKYAMAPLDADDEKLLAVTH